MREGLVREQIRGQSVTVHGTSKTYPATRVCFEARVGRIESHLDKFNDPDEWLESIVGRTRA
jgi:hypothetical protein